MSASVPRGLSPPSNLHRQKSPLPGSWVKGICQALPAEFSRTQTPMCAFGLRATPASLPCPWEPHLPVWGEVAEPSPVARQAALVGYLKAPRRPLERRRDQEVVLKPLGWTGTGLDTESTHGREPQSPLASAWGSTEQGSGVWTLCVTWRAVQALTWFCFRLGTTREGQFTTNGAPAA